MMTSKPHLDPGESADLTIEGEKHFLSEARNVGMRDAHLRVAGELRETAGRLIFGNMEDGVVSTQMLCEAADLLDAALPAPQPSSTELIAAEMIGSADAVLRLREMEHRECSEETRGPDCACCEQQPKKDCQVPGCTMKDAPWALRGPTESLQCLRCGTVDAFGPVSAEKK